MLTSIKQDISQKRNFPGALAIFSLLWIVLFILYFPAAKAGRVGDFPGWVKNVSTLKFIDYVNRADSTLPSLYQFTQIATYIFYKLFGTKAWLWHLLFISMQAMNGCLLFVFFRGIFLHSGIRNGSAIAVAGALLFCVCPHISEVVVWEPAYHYLQALLFILLILLCSQKFYETRHIKYAWLGGILFFLSIFTLEMFYLTPLLVFTLSLYYRMALGYDKKIFTRSLLYFSIPQVLSFVIYLVLLHTIYHSGLAHIGSETVTLSLNNFSKPLKYIFHLLFLGRYFNEDIRRKIYAFCESLTVLLLFYALVVAALAIIVIRIKRMRPKGQIISLLFIWILFSVGLICPMWFPDSYLVVYDRYAYILSAFTYVLLAVLLSYIPIKWVAITAFGAYALVNVFFTFKVNLMWKVSGDIVNKLITTFPNDPSKVVLILNVPECLNGLQMIGSRDDGEFKLLYNAVMPQKINNPVFEVSASNIKAADNGAHVMVVFDSVIHVTLNQWGTSWYWFGLGARNYENQYYKLNLIDPGHWYELTLKKPHAQYLLLYIVDDQWKTVDMKINSIDQY